MRGPCRCFACETRSSPEVRRRPPLGSPPNLLERLAVRDAGCCTCSISRHKSSLSGARPPGNTAPGPRRPRRWAPAAGSSANASRGRRGRRPRAGRRRRLPSRRPAGTWRSSCAGAPRRPPSRGGWRSCSPDRRPRPPAAGPSTGSARSSPSAPNLRAKRRLGASPLWFLPSTPPTCSAPKAPCPRPSAPRPKRCHPGSSTDPRPQPEETPSPRSTSWIWTPRR
mmetsp:Transcript_4721/g.17848  ORF Transcript_4721/g.17848 Transcript_4721/m.17848 type:complete len:224 (+) Transcript_4721:1488-2159(+)